MEQDIDELLQEVENRFINKDNEQGCRKFLTRNKFSSQSSFRGDSSDYDDILRDIDDNTDTKEGLTNNAPVTYVTPRCFPVHLGGTNYSSGCSTIGTTRSCSNLHCISCDFAVYTFDNFQWLSDTGYLFLRTNMPEFERVKDRLLPSDGCRAYACQCCHYSTSSMKQVKSVPTLLWVCRGHSSHSTVSS